MALTIDGTNGIETNTDTGKIKVGADDDLQISHTGSISDIVQTTNTEFQIRHSANNGIQIRTENAYPVLIRTGGEESARFEANTRVDPLEATTSLPVPITCLTPFRYTDT